MNIELTIFPSGGGEKGYSIIVENDCLKTMLRDIGAVNDSIVVTNVKKEKAIMLSNAQQDSISSLLDNINVDFKSSENAFMFDTWIYVIAINKREIARFNSLTLLENTNDKQLNNLKKLIKQLIKLSPLQIDLQGFS